MTRRTFVAGGALAETAAAAPKRWNVLMVMADQHQAACTGVEGHAQVLTPHIDRLAAQGLRFRQAYTQNPICTPSRVSIFSGQYPHNHGFYGLGGRPPALPSFISHFRQHGYRTAAIGKVHVPEDGGNWIEPHCDLFAECYEYGTDDGLSPRYETYLRERGFAGKEDSIRLPEFPGRQQHEGRPSLLPYEHSVEGWSVGEAIRFIDQTDPRPFCMQVSLPRPHQCYTPDREFWERYSGDLALPPLLRHAPEGRPPHFRRMVERLRAQKWLIEPKTFEDGCRRVWRAYLACITQVDHALGQLLAHLDRTGKAENTIVIYTSDHGAYSGTYGVPEKAPGICSEAVCRVPMIWRVPGITSPGAVSGQFAELVDVAPTLTALCGLPAIDSVDGRDLGSLLGGASGGVREAAFTENPWSKAVRWGPWRFVHYPRHLFGADVGELYHLEKDPQEIRNLYADAGHAAVVAECRRRLLDWTAESTRIMNVIPLPKGIRTHNEVAAGDGKQSNRYGVLQRARDEQWNYL